MSPSGTGSLALFTPSPSQTFGKLGTPRGQSLTGAMAPVFAGSSPTGSEGRMLITEEGSGGASQHPPGSWVGEGQELFSFQ